jgi:hypothetical protein
MLRPWVRKHICMYACVRVCACARRAQCVTKGVDRGHIFEDHTKSSEMFFSSLPCFTKLRLTWRFTLPRSPTLSTTKTDLWPNNQKQYEQHCINLFIHIHLSIHIHIHVCHTHRGQRLDSDDNNTNTNNQRRHLTTIFVQCPRAKVAQG